MYEDLEFDIDTQSNFAVQEQQNRYSDSINEYKKYHNHQFNQQFGKFPVNDYQKYMDLKQSRGHFIFPERKLKTFNELDNEYYAKTQRPMKDYEKTASKKYDLLKHVYNFPYQSSLYQDDERILSDKLKVRYIADNPAGPYNENWVTDDSEERKIVGAMRQNTSEWDRIDGGLDSKDRNKPIFREYA